jgi:ribosomal protein S18 acetylase RimI-like enzyme
MDLTYQYQCEGIDWAEVEALFRATDLDGRAGDKIRRSFENSSLVCFVFACGDGDRRLVGICRAITDWEYHALIYDVAVHPELQRQGIGSAMMGELLARLPVWRIMLVSDEEPGQRFYRRLGFQTYENVMARLNRDRLYDPMPALPDESG